MQTVTETQTVLRTMEETLVAMTITVMSLEFIFHNFFQTKKFLISIREQVDIGRSAKGVKSLLI